MNIIKFNKDREKNFILQVALMELETIKVTRFIKAEEIIEYTWDDCEDELFKSIRDDFNKRTLSIFNFELKKLKRKELIREYLRGEK